MKNNLLLALFIIPALAFNCISCSHNKTVAVDTDLTGGTEVSSEGTDTNAALTVSGEAVKEVEEIVGEAPDKSELEATAGGDARLGEDPVLLGMESSMTPEDQTQVAQSSINDKPMTTSDLDNSVKVPTLTGTSTESTFGVLPSETKKTPDITKPNKKNSVPVPKAGSAPVEKKESAPVASQVDDPFADELNAPIPEEEKPKLAGAEIGSFIERHAFLVTLCGVAFVLGIFIFMRRKSEHDDHNLSV